MSGGLAATGASRHGADRRPLPSRAPWRSEQHLVHECLRRTLPEVNIGHDRDRRRHTEQKKNHQSLRCAFHCVPPTGKADIEFACHLKWDWSVAHLLPRRSTNPIRSTPMGDNQTSPGDSLERPPSARRSELHELLSGAPRSSIPRSADSPRWLRGYACSDSPPRQRRRVRLSPGPPTEAHPKGKVARTEPRGRRGPGQRRAYADLGARASGRSGLVLPGRRGLSTRQDAGGQAIPDLRAQAGDLLETTPTVGTRRLLAIEKGAPRAAEALTYS